MQTRGARKVRTAKSSRRVQRFRIDYQPKEFIVPIKSRNGNYWKACPKCDYQYLWDGGKIGGTPDYNCTGCGRLIKWETKTD